MKRLRKFLGLPSVERRLLITAGLLLGAIRLGLWLLPLETFRRLFAPGTQSPTMWPKSDRFSPERVAWAVTVASQYILGARHCLTQALAVQVLLARQGHPARLHIGVAKSKEGRIQAHAWVESDGRIVIGGTASALGRYTPLSKFGGKGS